MLEKSLCLYFSLKVAIEERRGFRHGLSHVSLHFRQADVAPHRPAVPHVLERREVGERAEHLSDGSEKFHQSSTWLQCRRHFFRQSPRIHIWRVLPGGHEQLGLRLQRPQRRLLIFVEDVVHHVGMAEYTIEGRLEMTLLNAHTWDAGELRS